MSIYLRGILLGLSIAAPVGPIGVLCIRRTLVHGWLSGLVSGLGAATADGIYGIIAGFGLTYISGYLVSQQALLRLTGGIFLCYLGIRTMLHKPSQGNRMVESAGLAGNYFSTFILTLTNPMTILSFTAIFAGFGLARGNGDFTAATVLVWGVFSGSALWWLTLSLGVGVFRRRVTAQGMAWVNRVSGVVILSFGILALLTLFFPNSPL